MRNYITLACITLILTSFCNAQNSNAKSWIEDINFYQKTLEEKHIDLYHTISKADFISELHKIKRELPKLTNFQVKMELMRLTRRIGEGKGDGHTSVPLWGEELHKYPIKLFDFDGELRVVRVVKDHEQLLGKKLKSIDGASIEEVYKEVSKLTPFTENKQSSMDRTCGYLIISELLHSLNFIKNENEATFMFVDDENQEESVHLKATTISSSLLYKNISFTYPKINKPDSIKLEGLWFSTLDEDKTVYIKFQRYPTSEDEMNTFSESVYNYIEANNCENLIIDFRDNYGGDFFKGQILASWLNASDSINWNSGVYVLTNRVTYSAAMVNVAQYRQLLNAKIVGESTGGNPNGYQDLGQFNLPNSNLLVTYTKRRFRLQDKNTKGVQPDVLIVPKWRDFKKGQDEVLEWVLSDIKNK